MQSPGLGSKRARSGSAAYGSADIAEELQRASQNDDDIHLDNLHHRKRFLTEVGLPCIPHSAIACIRSYRLFGTNTTPRNARQLRAWIDMHRQRHLCPCIFKT